MIKFFRKIRQRLLAENKITRYLFYAIGEIVLVVIGILIALQINNWNNEVQEDKLSLLYYKELLSDVESDIESLKGRIEYSTKVKSSLDTLIDALQNKTYSSANPDTLQYAMNCYYRVPGWTFNLNTYKELESSGNLRYIKNDEIKSAITEYANGVESAQTVRERYTADIISKAFYIDQYVFTSTTGNELVSVIDFEGLSNDQHIINYLSRIAMRWANNVISFKGAMEYAQKIRESILSELKINNTK